MRLQLTILLLICMAAPTTAMTFTAEGYPPELPVKDNELPYVMAMINATCDDPLIDGGEFDFEWTTSDELALENPGPHRLHIPDCILEQESTTEATITPIFLPTAPVMQGLTITLNIYPADGNPGDGLTQDYTLMRAYHGELLAHTDLIQAKNGTWLIELENLSNSNTIAEAQGLEPHPHQRILPPGFRGELAFKGNPEETVQITPRHPNSPAQGTGTTTDVTPYPTDGSPITVQTESRDSPTTTPILLTLGLLTIAALKRR